MKTIQTADNQAYRRMTTAELRERFLIEQYRGEFKPPARDDLLYLTLKTGERLMCTFREVTSNSVVVKYGDEERGYMRQTLDVPTRTNLFVDDYARWKARKQVEQEEKDLDVGPPQEGTAQAPVAPKVELIEQTIRCPACRGEGYLAQRAPKGTLEQRITCPICLTKGYVKKRMPVGSELCPDCQGTGLRLVQKQQLHGSIPTAVSCTRCNTKGYIVRAQIPGSSVAVGQVVRRPEPPAPPPPPPPAPPSPPPPPDPDWLKMLKWLDGVWHTLAGAFGG